MTKTPWGDADELRARRLPPGPATAPDVVTRNQRERLLAAMVAAVADHGYEAARVEDLVERSGVSRSAFYRHFADKRDCFLATLDELLTRVESGLDELDDRPSGGAEEALREALDRLVAAIGDQPASARMCLIDVYAAGPQATDRLDALTARAERFVARALDRGGGRGVPPGVVRGIVGGALKVLQTRVRRDEEGELPRLAGDLLDWALGYEPPPAPLRRSRARAPAGAALDAPAAEDARERLLAAMTAATAERGYPETTIAEVADVARASLTTFYACFAAKEDAFDAAIERAARLWLDVAERACERAGDWPDGVRDGLDAVLGLLAANPDLARVSAVEAAAGGSRALECRDRGLEPLERMLAGRGPRRGKRPLAGEVAAGAVLALVYEHVRQRGPERLRELTPVTTYLALAPSVGARQALAVANAAPGSAA